MVARPSFGLDLVEQLERVAAGPVPLVDEREQRQAALAAHLEQLEGLRLDALGASSTMTAASAAASTR